MEEYKVGTLVRGKITDGLSFSFTKGRIRKEHGKNWYLVSIIECSDKERVDRCFIAKKENLESYEEFSKVLELLKEIRKEED
jgi:hypothetical protein